MSATTAQEAAKTDAARPYETVIGIETHVELATRSKMFCGCSNLWFGAPPNTLVCPVCLGLPGALPVPNRRAIELAITAGLALHCETPPHTKFDRKNYLYPDLPKGYQISQYDLPLTVNGWLDVTTADGTKRVGIRRAHLEEDTGRLQHASRGGQRYSLVDFNRSGVPLLEIVSEPEMSSVGEALAYADSLRQILIYAGVSEFRLEEGAGRFDVNVSIRFTEHGEVRWPPQSEIKNLNSFRAVEEAVVYEAERLWDQWRAGGEIRTRTGKITVGWSPERRRTFLQRSKEEVEDYRYFPEPDLVALSPSAETVERLRAALPEMPAERRARFSKQYGLSDYDARILVSDPRLARYYEEVVAEVPEQPKAVANWLTGEFLRHAKEGSAQEHSTREEGSTPVQDVYERIAPSALGSLVSMVGAGTVSSSSAKDVFAEMWRSGGDPAEIVRAKGLGQVSDEAAIASAVEAVLTENPSAVASYRAGNPRALDALVGPVMKKMGGKANPGITRRLLVERLG